MSAYRAQGVQTVEDHRLLQACDAAREAGVTTGAIHRAVVEGRLRVAAVTVRGTRLFSRSDVEDYANARAARAAGNRDAA